MGLLKKAFSAQNLETAQAAVPKGDSQSEILKALVLSVDKQSTGIEQRCLASLAQALKVQDETVYVSMADKLAGINLAGLHQGCLPDGQLVNSVATEAARLVKKGVKVPFVAVDLFKCQPHWCNVHTGQDDGDKGRASKRMPILHWQMAFDRGALASAVCNQWSYASAMAHKNNCLKIAVRAELTSPPRRHWLAVIYDRLARREWQELAFHNSVDFNVNEVSLREDPCILKSAEAEFDRLMAEDKRVLGRNDEAEPLGDNSFSGHARRGARWDSKNGSDCQDCQEERPNKRKYQEWSAADRSYCMREEQRAHILLGTAHSLCSTARCIIQLHTSSVPCVRGSAILIVCAQIICKGARQNGYGHMH